MARRRYRPRGIPTKAFGVQFRSLLEAKWAAVFTLSRAPWSRWEYEPALGLRYYIPDFLFPDAPVPLIAEVKPIRERTYDPESPAFSPALQKLCRSGWRGKVLLLGVIPDCAWMLSATDKGVTLDYRVRDKHPSAFPDHVWKEAGNRTQWKPPRR